MSLKKAMLPLILLVVLSLVAAQCGAPAPTQPPAPAETEAPAAEAATEAPAVTEAATEAPAATEAAPAPAAKKLDKIKVAFVYTAPIGDMGWTWSHDQGRLALEAALGDKVETAYVESVPEGPEAERVIRDFAEKGFNLIITTSFGFMDPTATVADEYPDIWFMHVSGYKTAANMSNMFGRIYQPRYLSGLVAGSATDSNIIGYVAAFPIPEVIRGLDAFTLGVREVNPEAEVRVVWTNTWFGPQEEKEAAEALLAEGADVIAQHQDTTEPQKAAADAGALSVGYDSDMAQFVGDTVLTSPVWNWGPKYIEVATKIMEGTYETESYWGGLADNIVSLAPLSDKVPEAAKALVTEREELLRTGQWDVFCGPIKGANGKVIVAEGNCLTDAEKLSMDYFVEGVMGEAPNEAPEGIGEPSNMASGLQKPEAEAAAVMDKIKVAFVYTAPIGDMGWTWSHDQGRLALEEALGDKVETAYVESVPEGPEAERVIRDFAQKGFNLIITTSFGFMDPTATVAEEFPDTWFVHVSGYKTAANMSNLFGRIYQPRYLSGLVAGSMTKSNIVGYVAAFPIPEVIRGLDAFTIGVRQVNPDAEVRVVWTNTWFGPQEEKEAAEALLAEGADIIAQHQDTTEPQKAAADAGALSVGYDSDMAQFVGDTVLTSPVWNWGPKYIEIATKVMQGTYEPESYWGDMNENIVMLAPLSDKVPAEVAHLVAEREGLIRSGSWDVFCGPLKGANGKMIVDEGFCLTDAEKLSMDYFVEGVVGEAPNEAPEGIGETFEAAEAGQVTTPTMPAKEEIKAAFVYVGPVGDLGWSNAHDQGRQVAENELDFVTTAFSEAVAEGPDAERVIRDYAEKGYDIIFATSFGYMDSVIAVAADYPDTAFEHCTGYLMADNAAIYDGRGYEGWFLAGMTAGHMTTSNKLGYVAPFAIPEVIRNLNSFTLGAKSVNPDVTVTPVWIFNWYDPQAERQAAEALVAEGADVIARESDSPEPDKVAQENGIYAVGYNAVSTDVAPDAVLTAAIWNWGAYYKETLQNLHDGKWKSHAYWGHLSDGILDLAPFADFVPQEVQDEVNAAKAEIIAGDLLPFTGPIKDNKGELKVKEGESMTDEQLLSFDWLVEGVNGEIPK